MLKQLMLLVASFGLLAVMSLVMSQDTRNAEMAHYDTRLNEVYKAILSALSPEQQQKLREAQRAWITMRDSDCGWAFVDSRDCKIDRTVVRTKELEGTWFTASNGDYSSIEKNENVRSKVNLNCVVEKYLASGTLSDESEIKTKQLSYRVAESPTQAYVSRCSFSPPRKQVVCTQHKIDKVVTWKKSESEILKKYYAFSFQFDFQLYPDLSFVGNNGRGDVAYGKCKTAKD